MTPRPWRRWSKGARRSLSLLERDERRLQDGYRTGFPLMGAAHQRVSSRSSLKNYLNIVLVLQAEQSPLCFLVYTSVLAAQQRSLLLTKHAFRILSLRALLLYALEHWSFKFIFVSQDEKLRWIWYPTNFLIKRKTNSSYSFQWFGTELRRRSSKINMVWKTWPRCLRISPHFFTLKNYASKFSYMSVPDGQEEGSLKFWNGHKSAFDYADYALY